MNQQHQETPPLHKEEVKDPVFRFLELLFLLGAAVFLALILFNWGPLKNTTPRWDFLIPFFVLMLLTGVFAVFRKLDITITGEDVTINFGGITHVVPVSGIKAVYPDTAPAWAYWGWGIRIAPSRGGGWVLAYNTTTAPRVVLELKTGKFRRFVFSTRQPEAVTLIIKRLLK